VGEAPFDPSIEWMLEQLWSPIVAVTAAHEGQATGLVSSTALAASLVPEAPRFSVQLARWNLTHRLVLGSGALAVHLLAAEPDDALEASLRLFAELGLRSGRDAPKLTGTPTRRGVTGSPILEDALAYVEGRVVQAFDGEEFTIVVADVVGGARLREGPCLTIEHARDRLPPEELARWELHHERELEEARRLRLGGRVP
jgi:flavin reductase (DIM6/NTAB) family NADH-FMN oxidoreductase RutF